MCEGLIHQFCIRGCVGVNRYGVAYGQRAARIDRAEPTPFDSVSENPGRRRIDTAGNQRGVVRNDRIQIEGL